MSSMKSTRTFCRNVIRRAAQPVKHRQVSAPKDARSLAFAVEFVCRAGIVERGFFLQFICRTGCLSMPGSKIIFRLRGEMPCHRSALQRSEAVLLNTLCRAVMSLKPISHLGCWRNRVKSSYPTRCTAPYPPRLQRITLAFSSSIGFLQVFQPLLYASGVSAVRTACMLGNDNLQSP